MRLILTICACVALVYGKPEPPSGYNYQSASSSTYGAPSGVSGYTQGVSNGRFAQGAPSFGGFPQGGSSDGRFAQGGPSFGGLSQGGPSNGEFTQGGSSFGGHSGFRSASGQSDFGHSGNGYSSSSANNVVTKNVYVHLAPPDAEDRFQKRQQVHVPPPQKHYKIIFIKAPTPPTPTAPEIPPIPQDEEKTLVYVLIKKPEEQPEIVIPTAPPTEPSKPEVYFIKYKTQKEESGGHGDIGNNDISQDDTVVVDARQRGAHNGGISSSSFSSNGVASQYGPPDARGAY